MPNTFESRLAWLEQKENRTLLTGIKRGIEKESIRITQLGELSRNDHPYSLGSALTHNTITTDYSEALLELITKTHQTVESALTALRNTHAFVYRNLDNEYLWANSFPCKLGNNKDIPIAKYGTSNIGRMKSLYRKGLDVRYGRKMQTIAGIHYNFSLPASFWERYKDLNKHSGTLQPYISESYFSLIRNAQRFGWLPLLLFGNSTALDQSFISTPNSALSKLGKSTLCAPKGTSLRMSSIGYQNSAQSEMHICYNTLESYILSLNHAISTSDPNYEKLGLYDSNGEQQQINTNLLQIENEYYASVRPKRTIKSGERPTTALTRRGVQYVELRSIDLNPFSEIGIDDVTCCFLETFLIYALLKPSPLLKKHELFSIRENIEKTAYHGRDNVTLTNNNEEKIDIFTWAIQLLKEMQPIAACLASSYDDKTYIDSLEQQLQKVYEPSKLPSAQVLSILHGPNDQVNETDFIDFGMERAKINHRYFQNYRLTKDYLDHAVADAASSHEACRILENNKEIPFEAFLRDYFSE